MATEKTDGAAGMTLSEALAKATYVEQLHGGEQQWIQNRLLWLFVSQSFLVAAFVTLVTSKTPTSAVERHLVEVLRVVLPLVGLIFCFVVRLAVIAAECETRALLKARGELTMYINERRPVCIPLKGDPERRDRPWTLWVGALPQQILPWVLFFLWEYLLLALVPRI